MTRANRTKPTPRGRAGERPVTSTWSPADRAPAPSVARRSVQL